MKRFLWLLPLVALVACHSAEVAKEAPGFFDTLATAVSLIPGVGPLLAPVLHSVGGMIAATGATAGAGAVVAAAGVHHYHAGLTKGRKVKVAAKWAKKATPTA